MFTGLIESIGTVVGLEPGPVARRLTLASSWPASAIEDGESIAVDGVCVTVCGRAADRFWAELIPETLSRTTASGYAPGRRVNLERSLRVGDRLGGHLVQGHVDGTGLVLDRRESSGELRLIVELPTPLHRYISVKGSVAVDGVSLTVADLDDRGFEVALIPETLRRTNLGERRAGDRVNVEVDLLARYLERLLSRGQAVDRRPGSGP